MDLHGQALDPGGLAGSGGSVSDSISTAASITVNPSGASTYAGTISNGAGTVALAVGGSGTEVLTGSANTYTGGTTINSTATLQVGDGSSHAGSLPGAVTDNGALAFDTPASSVVTYSGNASGTGAIYQNGAGVVLLSGDNTAALGAFINSGTMRMGSSTGLDNIPVSISANSTLDLNSQSVTIGLLNANGGNTTSVITNSNSAATSTLTVTGGGNYTGNITDGAGHTALTVNSPSTTTLTLASLSSTYTGGTNVSGGNLQVGTGLNPATGTSPFTDQAMGTGPVTISNANLLLNTQGVGTTETFNFPNNFTLNGGGSLQGLQGVNNLNGSFTINGTGNTIVMTGSTKPIIINGTLSGSGAVTLSGLTNAFPPKNVEFFGDGTNYTGAMTLTAAQCQIVIGNQNALLNANLTITGNYTANNDTVDIAYPEVSGNTMGFAGSDLVFGNSLTSASIGSINSTNVGDGNIILTTADGESSAIALTIGNNNQNSNISGVISDTSMLIPQYGGSITKIGSGTLTLSGANTYVGGTTINAGTFVAADTTSSPSASSTGTANVALNGGVLASASAATSYILGSVIGGSSTHTIAPGGVGTVGVLSIGGSLTTTNQTTLNFDLGTGSGVVTNGDELILGSGSNSVASGTELTFGGTPSGGADYALIGDPVSGGLVGGISDSDFVLPTAPVGFTYALSNNGVIPGFIALVVTGPGNLYWDNGANTGLWNTGDSNWNNGSGNTTYSNGSNVTFNDSNGGNYAVTLSTTVSPGSVTVSSSGNYSITGAGTIVDTGAFTKSGTGTLTLGTGLTASSVSINVGTIKLASNTSAGTGSAGHPASNINITGLTIASGSLLDITNNHIIIDYTSSDPISTIYGYLKTGFNNGTWNGTSGIISSTAQTATNGLHYGVGWADGADGTKNVLGLSSGQILLKYTLLGDANLDGTVNGSDFSILAANFGLGVTNWDQGNFLYSSSVNGSDFSALAANFGQGDSGAAVSVTPADVVALDAFAAANGLPQPTITAVPEPASIGLLAAGAIGLLSRRRRFSKSPTAGTTQKGN